MGNPRVKRAFGASEPESLTSKPKSLIKPWDLILICMVCAAGLGILLFQRSQDSGESVIVMVDGREEMRIPLDATEKILVEGRIGLSEIRVESGRVWIEEAPCPHKTCMKMGKIRLPGDVLVCIPNRIVLRIEGENEKQLDGVTM